MIYICLETNLTSDYQWSSLLQVNAYLNLCLQSYPTKNLTQFYDWCKCLRSIINIVQTWFHSVIKAYLELCASLSLACVFLELLYSAHFIFSMYYTLSWFSLVNSSGLGIVRSVSFLCRKSKSNNLSKLQKVSLL